jgi:hypothetical protein
MSELNLILFEFYLLLAFFIFIFAFSIISAEPVAIFISIVLFFIFLIPFVQILNEIEVFAFNEGFETVFFKTVVSYSKLIVVFIGIFLFIELVYVFLFS